MAGVSQPPPLLAARQRAHALAASGECAAARVVLEDAVSAGRTSFGEDHPDVLTTAHQLARLHQQADDPTAARRVLEEAYAAGQWRLGDADPLMLEISYDLGAVAEELGNRHEARKAFGRVAGIGAEVLGADHWAVARARAYLLEGPTAVRKETARRTPVVPDRPGAGGQGGRVGFPAEAEDAAQREAVRRSGQSLPAPDGIAERPNAVPDPEAGRWDVEQRNGAALPGPYQQVNRPGPELRGEISSAQPHQIPPPRNGAVPEQPAAPHQRRGGVVFAAIAACLAAILAVVALVLVLAGRQSNPKDNVPTVAGRPPTDVRLDANGSDVRLTWTDPAGGRTSFLITGGHRGEVLRPMGQVGPGQTTYELHGLNAHLDYCFSIVAVYSTTTLAPSPQSCTSRVHPARSK
jgi:Tetratricopeptide repeat